jgi:hypothetical protein
MVSMKIREVMKRVHTYISTGVGKIIHDTVTKFGGL